MSHILQPPGFNRVLGGLLHQDAALIASAARVERLRSGRILAVRGEPLTDVWFPYDGLVGLSSTDDGGRTAQTGVAGNDGCVGVEALLDHAPSMADATVQIAGTMAAIPAGMLRAACRSNASIQAALTTYMYMLCAQSSLFLACNRLHSVERRCCTWLLIMRDRTGSAELPLTQDSLATLLGGGRPRINTLLGRLEESGLLQRHRRRIRLLDQTGLSRRACGCYQDVCRLSVAREVNHSAIRTVPEETDSAIVPE